MTRHFYRSRVCVLACDVGCTPPYIEASETICADAMVVTGFLEISNFNVQRYPQIVYQFRNTPVKLRRICCEHNLNQSSSSVTRFYSLRFQLAVTSVNFNGSHNEHYLTLFQTSTSDDAEMTQVGVVKESISSNSAALYPAAVTFSRDGQHLYVYYPDTTVRLDDTGVFTLSHPTLGSPMFALYLWCSATSLVVPPTTLATRRQTIGSVSPYRVGFLGTYVLPAEMELWDTPSWYLIIHSRQP